MVLGLGRAAGRFDFEKLPGIRPIRIRRIALALSYEASSVALTIAASSLIRRIVSRRRDVVDRYILLTTSVSIILV